MQWKTYFYLNPLELHEEQGKSGIQMKSLKTPPSNKMLDTFYEELFKLIEKIKFKKQKINFPVKMEKAIKEMKKSEKIWVKADKSRNIYKISPLENDRISHKITDDNKIDYNNTITQINSDIAQFACKLYMKARLGKLKENCACILFKDHKQNFHNKKQKRLINPNKTELGLVSKVWSIV